MSAANKENCPGTSRKSKLPMPVSTKKGVKRPNCESDCPQQTEGSPMKSRRQPLVEKNTQRKKVTVSKVKGNTMRKTASSSSMNPNARQSQRLQNQKAQRIAEGTKPSAARKLDDVATTSILNQKGIEFEADESALQSILDNTGIERSTSTAAATAKLPPRHTMAGTTNTTGGIGMFGKPQQPYKKPDFKQWCDQYLHRMSMHQFAAKRRCLEDKENKTDSGYKFDDNRQSDVNFCQKYNVPNNPSFTTKQEQDDTTLGKKTSSQGTLSTFRTPGRLSLVVQTPQRVKIKDVKQGTESEACSSTRASMGPPARLPVRVDSTSTTTQETTEEDLKAPRLSLFGRPSLSSQTPGRVSRPSTETVPGVMPSDSRLSYCPVRVLKTVPEDLGFPGTQTPRLSLIAQTPSRVPKNQVDKEGLEKETRFSLSAQVLRKPMTGIFDNEGSMIAPRLSLAAQTPGRVPKAAPESTCLTAQTPGRVSLSAAPTKGPSEGIKMNLDDVFKDSESQTPGKGPQKNMGETAKHTPLRVRTNPVFDSPMHTPGRVPKGKQSKSSLVEKTPLRELRSALESSDRYGTPTRILNTPQPTLQTPLRVQNTQNTAAKHTPLRVPATPDNTNNITHTPLRITLIAPESTKEKVYSTPITPKQKRYENLPKTPVTPLQRLNIENSDTTNEKDQGTRWETNVPQKKLTPILKKGTPKSLFDGKGSPGLTTDLRSVWKTKKSANKTPVKKEILTPVVNGGIQKDTKSSPRPGRKAMTSDKKKRTLTWADNLESFKSVGHKREKKLHFCDNNEGDENIDTIPKVLLFHAEEPISCDDAIGSRTKEVVLGDESVYTAVIEDEARVCRAPATLDSHDEMQESPSQENRNTSPPHHTCPPHTTHNTPAIQDSSMQLPVMVAGTPVLSSGDRVTVDNDAWIQQVEGKKASPDDLTTVAMSTLQSTRHSPQQPGQGQGEEWKAAASKKLEQIEEYLQNRLKSTNQTYEQANNNNADLKTQALDVSASISNNNNVDTVWRSGYYGDRVWNQSEVAQCGEIDKVDNHSQGSPTSTPRGLDVNSNITLTTAATQQNQETVIDKVSSFNPNPFQTIAQTSTQDTSQNKFHISPTTPQNKRQQDCDENLTPFILRNFEESVVNTQEDYMEEGQEQVEEMVIGSEAENQSQHSLQTGTLYFPTPLAAVKREFVAQSETGTKGIELPIWTPLALRAAARQQHRGDENALNFSLGSCVDKTINSDSNDERLVLSEISNNQNKREENHNSSKSVSPASKALNEKKTAFRSLNQHGRLKPSAGPLSLRGNLNTSLKHKRQCRQSSHLQTLLQLEHKRFHEAVLDDEVELYMCRLAKRRMVGRQRECCNPVAQILTEGDDMSFVPIREEEVSEKASGLESAFEKCMRST